MGVTPGEPQDQTHDQAGTQTQNQAGTQAHSHSHAQAQVHAQARADRDRLDRLLGSPELSWLLARARRRLEREESLAGSVTLARPTPAQRQAVERLLGRAPRASGSLSVRLEALDGVLRASGAAPDGLAAAVTALTGPVVPLRAVREQEEAAWSEAFSLLEALTAPELAHWSVRLRSDGVVRRLCRNPETARTVLADAVAVLGVLPVEPATSLPALAARVLGSAHALDDGTPLASVVLSGARALSGCPDGSGARWRRAAWASAGVIKDDVSSTVLTLNLPGNPALDWARERGEPMVLTLRQLVRLPLAAAPETIHICENPAVLSAVADACGPARPPLVCLQGQPSAAALTLLRQARAKGATLRYHGDFDWGGLRIAATLLRHVPWEPWRYTARDYRALAARTSTFPRLTGSPFEAPWDPELAPALSAFGVRIEEETVLDELLADLTPPAPAPGARPAGRQPGRK